MYIPENKLTGSNNYSLSNYIDGNDVYNSKFLYLFMKLPPTGYYTINRYEKRIDLISQDIYAEDYSDLLLMYNSIKVEGLTLGKVLRLFSIQQLDNLISNLDDI